MQSVFQNIVQWCNVNEGFTASVLSLVGLVISIIAIWVSISTARLPYKKRILLSAGTQLETGMYEGKVITRYRGISVSVTNIGNAPCNIQFVGLAIRKNRRIQKFYPVNREFQCKGILSSMEALEVEYLTEELVGRIVKEKTYKKIYACSQDNTGKIKLKKIGTVGKLLKGIQSANFETTL